MPQLPAESYRVRVMVFNATFNNILVISWLTQIVIMMFEDPTKVRFKVVSSNPAQARCTRCNVM
jgi:hypothetical protein